MEELLEGAGVELSGRVGGKRKHRAHDSEECYAGQTTVLQFKTEQMRLAEERRDRNRSESRPRRGERKAESEKTVDGEKRERTRNINRRDVNGDMPFLSK